MKRPYDRFFSQLQLKNYPFITKGNQLTKMKKKLKITIQKTIEFVKSPRGETIRYIIIGGCTTLIDYLSYYAMVLYLHMDITVSNIVSATLAILFAYVTNKFLVFVSHTSSFADHVAEFIKFIASRLFTMVLEFAGVYLFVNILGQDYRIGKGETIVVVIIVNYFLSKYIVFSKNKHTEQE